MLVAPDEEVVPHREQHVNVGVLREPAEELGEPCLGLRAIEREQLLELIHHEERLAVALAPPPQHGEGDVVVVEAQKLLHRLRVACHLGGQRLREGRHRCPPGHRDDRTPLRRSGGDHSRVEERRLPGSRGADEGQELSAPEPLPQRHDLVLAPEEDLRVLLRERREPGIGATGLRRPRPPDALVARDLPAEGVAEAVDGPDEAWLAGVVAQGLADGVHRHAQGGLGDEDPGPDDVADLGPGERPGPALHEEAQQLVGLGLEGHGLPRAEELPALPVELEVPELQGHGPLRGGGQRNPKTARMTSE